MDHPVDPVIEADLQAYVEGQLPVARRIEVEAHLCHDRGDALRVMEDLIGSRTEHDDNPTIHYGLIASANQLMKDALIRDSVKRSCVF